MGFANITPTVLTDGIIYSVSVPITPVESDLWGGTGVQSPDPIPVIEGQTILAVIQLAINGNITSANTFIFLQTDLGNGIWVDVAWINSRLNTGSQTFVICGGNLGAANNAFGPQRATSATPPVQANGSNSLPLGGRVRFTGFTQLSGGSSALAGSGVPLPQATISYRIQHPR